MDIRKTHVRKSLSFVITFELVENKLRIQIVQKDRKYTTTLANQSLSQNIKRQFGDIQLLFQSLKKKENYEVQFVLLNNYSMLKMTGKKTIIVVPQFFKERKPYQLEEMSEEQEGTKEMNNSNSICGVDKNGNGIGKQIHQNEDFYEGEFQNFLYHGQGKYIHSCGDKYEGQFKKGLRQGKGKFYYHHGDHYQGEFKNNLIHGRGIYFYHSGDRYEGQFQEEKKHGYGIYYFKTGQTYEGHFNNDAQHGKGKVKYQNGTSRVQMRQNGRTID